MTTPRCQQGRLAMPGKSEACCMLNRQVMTFCILFAHCFHLRWGLETLFIFIGYHWISFDIICIAHGFSWLPCSVHSSWRQPVPVTVQAHELLAFRTVRFLCARCIVRLSEMAMMEAKPGSRHGKLMEVVWLTP